MDKTNSPMGLLAVSIISIWASILGLGFLTVRHVRQAMPDAQSVYELRILKVALVLGYLSIALFFLTWLGILCGMVLHR